MEFTRTQRIVIGAGIGVALISGATALALRGCGRGEVTVVNVADQRVEPVAQQTTGYLTVHVIGAVHRPGLYYLNPGARVYDAVRAAGGFAAGANDQALNLAAFVQDGEQVRVPARAGAVSAGWSAPPPAPVSRAASAVAPSPASHSPAPSYPPPASGPSHQPVGAGGYEHAPASAPRAPAQPGSAPSASARGGAGSGHAELAQRTPAGTGFPLSVNHATEGQLQALPGVGPVLAERIVTYRMEQGPFERLEDLLNVKGIGQQTLAQMAPYITVP